MVWNPGVTTSAGCKIYIGATTVAQPNPLNDPTYVEIGEATDLGAFGRTYTEIPFVSVANRATRKFKGSYNDGNMMVKLGRNVIDAGQAAALVALDSDLDYNFKLTLNDSSGGSGTNPSIFFFTGKIMGNPTTIGGPNQVVAGEATIGIHSGSITLVQAT